MIAEAGFLLGAVATPEIGLRCHHSLLKRGQAGGQHSAVYSQDQFGFLWMPPPLPNASRAPWPFPDRQPRVNAAGQAFARIAAAAAGSDAMHWVTVGSDPLSIRLYGQPVNAVQAAAFSRAGATDTCYVFINRHSRKAQRVRVNTPAADTAVVATALVAGSIPGWRYNGTRCEGDGLRCWAPLPEGPIEPTTVEVQESELALPPLSIVFVRVGGDGAAWCSAHPLDS